MTSATFKRDARPDVGAGLRATSRLLGVGLATVQRDLTDANASADRQSSRPNDQQSRPPDANASEFHADPDPYDDDTIAADRAARLDAAIRELEVELAVLRQQRRDVHDAAFVRLLARTTQGAAFTVKDLLDRRRLDPELAGALAAFRTPRHVGQYLAVLIDRDVAGVSVQRIKNLNAGVLWIVAVAVPPTP